MAAALGRRALLATGAAALLPARPSRAAARIPSRAVEKTKPRVAIIGGGLAGLACAVSLWTQKSIAATIYEYSATLGGRVKTLRGYFAGGLQAELCGQFISPEHTAMRALATRYGLTLLNDNHHLGNTTDTFWFSGQRYTAKSLAQDWQNFGWPLFNTAAAKAGNATWRHITPIARQWDAISATEWVEQNIPGGAAAPFGALCIADTLSENGSAAEAQSGLNIVYLLGNDTSRTNGIQPKPYPELAGTNELYQIAGGNDQIITGLINELPAGTVQPGHQLIALRGGSGRPITCVFNTGGTTAEITADHVVLTLPPTALRQVDLTGLSLSPRRLAIIAGATLGTNAKIFLQVKNRPWITDTYSGNCLTDLPICGGWDAGNSQVAGHGAHAQGIWVAYPGGTAGAALPGQYGLTEGQQAIPAPHAMVTDTLAQAERLFPGMTAAFNAGPGLAFTSNPSLNPALLGAYSNYLVGQFTLFAGAEGLPEHNLHFAGEYTSNEFQGFMEGGVRSGLRAAGEIG